MQGKHLLLTADHPRASARLGCGRRSAVAATSGEFRRKRQSQTLGNPHVCFSRGKMFVALRLTGIDNGHLTPAEHRLMSGRQIELRDEQPRRARRVDDECSLDLRTFGGTDQAGDILVLPTD